MSNYNFDITSAEVSAFLPFKTIGATSDPTTTNTTVLITLFSAQAGTILLGKGITPSDITTSAYDEVYQLCRQMITRRVAVQWVTSNNGGVLSDMDERTLDEWDAFLLDLHTIPQKYVIEPAPSVGFKTPMDATSKRKFWPRNTSFN